jgi:hypothetical protein
MSTVHLVVVAATVLANTAVVVADLVRAPFVLKTSAEVGVPPSWLPLLASLKGAGAAGLVIGTVALPPLAVAAAGGLGSALRHPRGDPRSSPPAAPTCGAVASGASWRGQDGGGRVPPRSAGRPRRR